MKEYDKKLFVKSLLLYHCAPTIFCNKPSTIITIEDFDISFYKLWRELKEDILRDYEIKCFEIKLQNNKLTVLLYNENKLEKTLKLNIEFLKNLVI
ncbi:DUF3793 family protein [Caloramator sp. mosi_1]|uniref:DUF3793 family protein n=1 Tax=Caloramator sp. mosi_1 TaxID=3023090 RepID=UPI003FCE2862